MCLCIYVNCELVPIYFQKNIVGLLCIMTPCIQIPFPRMYVSMRMSLGSSRQLSSSQRIKFLECLHAHANQ